MIRRLTLPLLCLISLAILVPTASAMAAGPHWEILSGANTSAAPGQQFTFHTAVRNDGDAEMDGGPVTFTAHVPAGMTIVSAGGEFQGFETSDCHGPAGPADPPVGAQTIICDATAQLSTLRPDQSARIPTVVVDVKADAAALLTAQFEIEGGGAPLGRVVEPTSITSDPTGFGIDAFDAQVAADSADSPFTQAAGHPYSATAWLDFNRATSPNPFIGDVFPVEPVKDILVDLPPGFIGNPGGIATCSAVDLANSFSAQGKPLCVPASQVGVVKVFTAGGVYGKVSVFNMEPPVGVPARFGFNYAGTVVALDAELRSGSDYGVSVNVRNVSEGLAVGGTALTFWGDPSAADHTSERSCAGEGPPFDLGPTCPSNAPPAAFLRNPTSCEHEADGLTTTLRIDSWTDPGDFKEASILSHDPPGYPLAPEDWGPPQGPTGCDAVPFEPAISVQPTTTAADSPTGLKVELTLPQTDDPETIATSDLKKAVVTLPEGMTVNPSSADGLEGCTLAQIDLHTDNTIPTCPDGSKIGTAAIKTPLLDHEVQGTVYLAAQEDNPFKSLLALYIVGEDPQSGVVVKLPGRVEVGPGGRLTTVFDNQPQLPFETLHLELNGGPRAPLRTPPTCGHKTTTAALSPWARPAEDVNLTSSFAITSGPNGTPCANSLAERPFDPGFEAGSQNPLGGALSPFLINLSRPDGSQELAGLTLNPPPGLTAVLKGVPYCPEAALAQAAARSGPGEGALERSAPSCPAASQIGTLDVGAGAGPLPFHVGGSAYLAGPYKGAPLSVAVIVPAVAGPFDLGAVMIRSALRVDPTSAQITVVSDPLPSELQGIGIDIRSAAIKIDRPAFSLNPTSCDVMAATATLTSTQGRLATPSSRYQLLGCRKLPFEPRLTLTLKGGTKRGQHPALRAVLKAKPGEANIAKARVTLPHSEFLAQDHLRNICTRVRFAADRCPKGSVYGHAMAISPLLAEPLRGPVYLRSSNHTLPDLVADLNGQIEIILAGRIDSRNRGIRNSFEVVPDAPVSKFVLTMQGAGKGLLENSRDLCRSAPRATVLLDAHNGKVHDTRPLVRAAGCGKGGKKRGAAHAGSAP